MNSQPGSGSWEKRIPEADMLAVIRAEDESQVGLGEHRKLAGRLVLAGCGAQTRPSRNQR